MAVGMMSDIVSGVWGCVVGGCMMTLCGVVSDGISGISVCVEGVCGVM